MATQKAYAPGTAASSVALPLPSPAEQLLLLLVLLRVMPSVAFS
eukprot:COSAG02_NODE_56_length_43700_cov_33.650765_1_plen_43_part_10